ncbi:hypothetical protein [Emcibacter sp.]|uniref:hypothetical protein n=1 Tax=Emcibacter sp. TaxID=1979954 RepID=UPI002AA6F732|nr:hypothetical protein [Emcibacter sp.]
MTKYAKTEVDLREHLKQTYQSLCLSNHGYDQGFVGEAARIAQCIRVLVHDTNSSHSLLSQLNKKDIPFHSTPMEDNKGNLLESHHLVYMRFGAGDDIFVPILDDNPTRQPFDKIKFNSWWKQVVSRFPSTIENPVKGATLSQAGTISRKQLVLTMANKDGGAHVDPVLTSHYAKMSKFNKGGWILGGGGKPDRSPTHGPQYATVRQIGHEIKLTLEHNFSDLCNPV